MTTAIGLTIAGAVLALTGDPPASPEDVASSATGPDAITVTWSDGSAYPANATSFRVFRSDDGGTEWQSLAVVPATTLSYEDSGLTPGPGYRYRVTAINCWGESLPVATTEVFLEGEPDTPPVAAFTGSPLSGTVPFTLSLIDQSTNSPTSWAWTVTLDAEEYGTSSEQNPSFLLEDAGLYTIALIATNGDGSDTETKTDYVVASTAPASGVPAPPTYAYVSAGDASALVRWESCFGATSYKVYRDGVLVHTESGAARQYEDTGLANATPYAYTVKASNASGDSQPTTARSWPGLTDTVTPASGRPSVADSFENLNHWYDMEQASDGSAAVSEPDVHVLLAAKAVTDDGTTKAPRVAGPGSSFARQTTAGASFRFGSEKTSEPGYRPFTVVARFKWLTDGAFSFARYDSSDWGYLFSRSGANALARYRKRDGSTVSLTVTGGGVTGEWVTGAMVFDPPVGTVTAYVVRASGTVLSVSGALPVDGPIYTKRATYFGARSRSTGSLGAPLAWGAMFRRALTQAELVRLNSMDSYSQGRFLPPADPSAPPFSGLSRVADFFLPESLGCQGCYFLRPYPVSGGGVRWFWSTDHYDGNVLPDPQGIWTGTSESASTAPAAKSLVVATGQTIPLNVNNSQTTTALQSETPYYAHNPDDPDGKPHYLYYQAAVARSGIANSQQTCMVKSASMSFTSPTFYGVTHPNGVDSTGQAQNHTGYQKVYPPGTFPGTPAGEWHSYGINNTDGTEVLTVGSTGLTFPAATAGIVLDTTSAFPGWTLTHWMDSMFVAGGRVWGVGKGRYLESPGVLRNSVVLVEVGQDSNGRYTKVIGGPWELYHGYGSYPGPGYVHDVKCYYEGDATRALHVYPVRGTYAETGTVDTRDQVADHISLTMEV